MKDKSTECQFKYYSTVQSKSVEWLWYPYIPYGKITLLQGDPGEGKSTFIVQVAALLTRGENMPDGFVIPTAETVVYQCAEDGIEDTIKPRLLEANADCDKVAYIIEGETELILSDERIDKVLTETKARLLVLDPIQAFIGQDGDMQSASRMRYTLKKLSDVADKHRCAIVLVGHLNKASGGKNLYRGLGSIDIAAQARSILMVARDKMNSSLRYMFPVKSSLAPEGDAIQFEFTKDKGFGWLGRCEIDVNEFFATGASNNKKEMAKQNIIMQLQENDMPSNAIFVLMEKMGISKRTVNDAKKELEIESYKKGGSYKLVEFKMSDATELSEDMFCESE
jgi:hypothetical protein